jgi:hypothetical protein
MEFKGVCFMKLKRGGDLMGRPFDEGKKERR